MKKLLEYKTIVSHVWENSVESNNFSANANYMSNMSFKLHYFLFPLTHSHWYLIKNTDEQLTISYLKYKGLPQNQCL